jgi:hypothetical protein
VLLVVIASLVIFSPLLLVGLLHLRYNWSKLSNIGQTYGAVSALLSSLALAGVVVSLLFQSRDGQTAREQASRTLQHELIKMELEDPSLMTAMGAPWGLPLEPDSGVIREFLFIQMWVSFLAGNYVIGESSTLNVRGFAADELFRSRSGRLYWELVGQGQLASSSGRRNRFFRLINEEYAKVIASGVL